MDTYYAAVATDFPDPAIATGPRIACNIAAFPGNFALHGQLTPVLAKDSKSFSLVDTISVGVDRMQRNFEPMRKQVELWRQSELPDVTAQMIIRVSEGAAPVTITGELLWNGILTCSSRNHGPCPRKQNLCSALARNGFTSNRVEDGATRWPEK